MFLYSCSSPVAENGSGSSQPLTDGVSAIRAEAGPVTIIPPEGYWVENGVYGVSIAGAGEAGSMLIGMLVENSSGRSADLLIEDYMYDLPSGWNRLIEDEEVGQFVGRGSRYSLEEGTGVFLTGRVVALTTETRDYLFFAVMDQEDWISRGSADFSAMISSIEIDDAASPQVNFPDSEGEEPDVVIPKIEIPKVEIPVIEVPSVETPAPSFGLPPFDGQSADGYACFSGFDTGLNCILPTGEWVHHTKSNSALKNESIFDMTTCPDGRILLSNVSQLTLFDGIDFVYIESPETYSSPNLVGCGPNDEIWLVYYQSVVVYRDGAWDSFEKSEVVKDTETIFEGLEIGPDGTAWLMSFNEVSMLAPGQNEWTIYAEGEGLNEQYFFDGLSLDTQGTPYLSHGNGYIWLDGDQWQTRETETGFFGDMEVSAENQVYLTTFDDGLLIADQDDSIRYQTMLDGLSRNDIDLIESDGQGRIWVTTETGVDVYDGDSWTQIRMDNSELAHNRFQSFVVIGRGPELPATSQEPLGSLTGQLIKSGSPLVNVSVTLCFNGYISYSDPGENPCDSSVELFMTETDRNGEFLIENVPAGWYELFFKVAGVWQELQDEDGILSEIVLIQSGETTDIGETNAE